MEELQLIEGTWENLVLQAEELRGKRLKVIVLPAAEEQPHPGPQQRSLADMLKGRTGVVSFEPTDPSRNTGREFTEILIEKQHQGGR